MEKAHFHGPGGVTAWALLIVGLPNRIGSVRRGEFRIESRNMAFLNRRGGATVLSVLFTGMAMWLLGTWAGVF